MAFVVGRSCARRNKGTGMGFPKLMYLLGVGCLILAPFTGITVVGAAAFFVIGWIADQYSYPSLPPAPGSEDALMKKNVQVIDERAPDDRAHKKCSFCAEIIKAEAKICRFCGRDVPINSPADN